MGAMMDAFKNILTAGNENLPLYSKIFVVDFYDGPKEGLLKITNSEEWIMFSTVFFSPETNVEIFSMLDVPEAWLLKNSELLEEVHVDLLNHYKTIKREIRNFYKDYAGGVYLLRCSNLKVGMRDMTQISLAELKYFSSLDKVISQSKKAKSSWTAYFDHHEGL